ncbi:MAG TPA: glycosyltransferase family 2 protein [Gemmatimonadales bacterium]|jgi:cellulose synthase/poly-beta-1,6-N-acetylglucosamine synthase-like glycosyltransferase|nr:glycosyltransferase family 2 protein [Gemmatimonadales bacterium]
MRLLLVIPLYLIVAVMVIYTIRHYCFTLNRLFGRHRQPYVDIGSACWPRVAVFIPCHNEEKVVGHLLDALLAGDYPAEQLVLIPIDDRSSDRTRAILADYADRFPGRVFPYRRRGGKPGKAAALKDASTLAPGSDAPIHLVFDADYLPGRGLIKQLVAPFFDIEVGAVMGRVVPMNVNKTLLTRLLDLERTGGYQVDQQARMNLRLVPQYGGTVGGVRRSALLAVGGWRDDTLAEDTDMTFRLVLAGWEVAYQNRSECYEEVPENWPSRIAQIKRWARGHNQSLARHWWPLLKRPRHVPRRVVLDGLLLLGVYAVGPLLVLGWGLALALYYLGVQLAAGLAAIFAVAMYSTLGNFAAFFEVAAGARLDGSRGRLKLLPFLIVGFLVSLVSVTWATVTQVALSWRRGNDQHWEKTARHRPANMTLPNGEA